MLRKHDVGVSICPWISVHRSSTLILVQSRGETGPMETLSPICLTKCSPVALSKTLYMPWLGSEMV